MAETRPPRLPATRYAFGLFVVDAVRRTLRRDGRVVPITAKTFDVLLVLLEHRNSTVHKDELLSRVWSNTVVHENNLARQVSSLRRALGQGPDQHDYIVTIPGEGYRFVAVVEPLLDTSSKIPSDTSIPTGAIVADESGASTSSAAKPLSLRAAEAVRQHRWLLPLGALVIALGGAVAASVVAQLRSRDQQPPPRRALERVTYDEAALAREPAWSADGRSVVYVSNRAGSADLWKQDIGNPDPARLTTSEFDETQPAWSPDGRWIAFRSERDGGVLYVMDADAGAQRMVSPFGYEPRWSPDGAHILFKRSAVLPDLPNVYVVGLDGRPPRPLRPDILGRFTTLQTAWHPDGRSVSIWGTIGRTERRFFTVPLSGDNATIPRSISGNVQRGLADLSPGRFVWAPSRRYIYFEAATGEARNVWRVTIDPQTGKWVAGPEPLTTGPGTRPTSPSRRTASGCS